MSASEAMAGALLEARYMTRNRLRTYVACEDLDFTWCRSEVLDFDRMWAGGLGIEDIAKSFGRDADEVALLAMDRANKGKIGPRRNGIFGRRRR